MKNENKLKYEKYIMNISLIGSVLFMIAEGVMAFWTRSHSILMDCIFDLTDLIMIGPFLLLVPLLYKPVTERRPYGFAQVESLFVVIKYSVLLAITVRLVWDNFYAILHGGREVDGGKIAVFELIVCACCLIVYMLLHYFSRRYASMTIQAEIYIWKLDVISSLGVSLAFFVEQFLQKTTWNHLAAYIDPIVAIIMSCLLLVEPVKMIIHNVKSLILFAPDQEIMDSIRQIADEINVLQGERHFARDNKSLGKFKLTGIRASFSSKPQIEVTFDIDVNGVVKVSAKDLGTGREQNITITGSTNLSENEIQRAMADAAAYEEEDTRRRERLELHNQAEMLAYKVDEALSKCKKELDKDEKNRVKNDLASLRRCLRKDKPEKMNETEEANLRQAKSQLEASANHLMVLYSTEQDAGRQ